MKKNIIMLMLVGLAIQSSLNAVGLLKRFKERKAQHTQMKLSAIPGQKTTSFATSPVAQTVGVPRMVKKSGFTAQGTPKKGWHGTTQRTSKVSGPPKITVGATRSGSNQQVLYTEKGASFQARPQVVSGTLAKPRKQTLGLVSEQGVPYQVKAREVSSTLRKPVKHTIGLKTEQGASYQASSREVMDLRRSQGVQQQQLAQPMMPAKRSPGFGQTYQRMGARAPMRQAAPQYKFPKTIPTQQRPSKQQMQMLPTAPLGALPN